MNSAFLGWPLIPYPEQLSCYGWVFWAFIKLATVTFWKDQRWNPCQAPVLALLSTGRYRLGHRLSALGFLISKGSLSQSGLCPLSSEMVGVVFFFFVQKFIYLQVKLCEWEREITLLSPGFLLKWAVLKSGAQKTVCHRGSGSPWVRLSVVSFQGSLTGSCIRRGAARSPTSSPTVSCWHCKWQLSSLCHVV